MLHRKQDPPATPCLDLPKDTELPSDTALGPSPI